MEKNNQVIENPVCFLPNIDHLSGVKQVELYLNERVKDYVQAMDLAKKEAIRQLGDCTLISWYDRDRDFESPQHVTESESELGLQGYVYYSLNHQATLRIEIERGRFVFFFAPVKQD